MQAHHLTLRCTPDGRLLLEGKEADWLTFLADALPVGADAALSWAHQFGRVLLNRLCQVRDLAQLTAADASVLKDFVARLPPLAGAEYVTVEVLASHWQHLVEQVTQRALGDLDGWILTLGEEWRGIGRVMFHLAENKNDAQKPFAFLATFAERVSADGRVQHLPLARALQRYSAAQDESALAAILEPVRRAAGRCAWVADLLESKRLFQALAWTPEDAYPLVRELSCIQDCGVLVKVPDWWEAGRPARPVVQVVLEQQKSSSVGVAAMLSLRLSIALNGETLSADELEKIRAAKSGLVTLRGRWVEINAERLDQVLEHWQRVQRMHEEVGLSFHQGMRYLSGYDAGPSAASETGTASITDVAPWQSINAAEDFTSLLQTMRDGGGVSVPEGLCATLRPYQVSGFEWLWTMQELGLGACLADDMGLGKTLQVIALLLKLKQTGAATPALVVCPASLIGNWRSELRKFAPALAVRVAHGAESTASGEVNADDVVLTTYTTLTRAAALTSVNWDIVILDEAQAIKNAATQQTSAVKRLRSRARIALTGTPIENRPSDLWSLFDFLNPGLLGSAVAFAGRLRALESERGIDYGPLRRLLQPYLLRRMKTDKRIISDLPTKIDVKERCSLTRRQAVIYSRLVEELRRVLNDDAVDGFQRRGQVLGFLTKFKQVCNHPSHYSGDGRYDAADSGKFARLAELAAEIGERQERLIVFTQYQEMCAPLAAHLEAVFGRGGLVLHGGTPVTDRQRLVERFQSPDGPPFFVVSVKAGGTGLTLTAANHVIHFDRWWNPAVENQATDRAYRIGQRRTVVVHKFVVAGTLEERVDQMLAEKQTVANELLETDESLPALTEMSAEQLLQLVALDIETIS
jgi:superfamily II DNA or RNA helicase